MKKMFALPLGMLLLCMMIGNAFADKPKNQQIVSPADATQADSTATADFQDMPPLDLNNPIDFMNDETVAASSIAVDPPGAVPNVVSVANFSGSFVFNGKTFPFTIMGNDPSLGHKTNIPAKIVSVDVQLLNADGTIFATVPVAPFENLTLNSPNFRRAHYTVGNVQFGDAVQRAEFFNHMKDNWHTNLSPVKIVEHVTVTVPFTVTVRIRGVNTTVRTWFTRTATDGNTVVFMLQQFFNAQFSNISVNAINTGAWTTDAMNVQIWPNTFLFTPSATPLVTRGPCCVLGFHTLFRDTTVTPQPRWVVAYASWISPGTFIGDVGDITPISHEILEAFNDPFLNNATPRWQFPVGASCQGNLETGDPVEVLPHSSFPVTLTIRPPGNDGDDADDDSGDDGGDGGQRFTFHPQTEALIQWFTQTSPSDAFRGAFSYPDMTALPAPAKPCPQ